MTPRLRQLAVAALAPCCAALFGMTGCEPCAFIGCSSAPRLTVEAQLLQNPSGAPARTARVWLITNGPEGRDSVSTVADDRGFVHLTAQTPVGAADGAELLVQSSGTPEIRIQLPCKASRVKGGGCAMGSMVVNPTFTTLGELHYRTDESRLGAGLKVTFHVTHGPPLLINGGLTDDFSTTTGEAGRFNLFPDGVYASGGEPVTGDLSIQMAAPYDGYVSVIHDVTLSPDYRFAQQRGIATWLFGPSLAYYIFFYDPTTHAPVAGVTAQFKRTGGIPLRADSYTATSDAAGKAFFGLIPEGIGSVTCDFIIRPPGAAAADTIGNVTLPVFDQDARLFGVYYVNKDGTITAAPPGTLPP